MMSPVSHVHADAWHLATLALVGEATAKRFVRLKGTRTDSSVINLAGIRELTGLLCGYVRISAAARAQQAWMRGGVHFKLHQLPRLQSIAPACPVHDPPSC